MTQIIPLTELLRALRVDESAVALSDSDKHFLQTIDETTEPQAMAELIHLYYGDFDRANRTPRSFLYLHLGMLAGAVARLGSKPS
jgi:hypothetical protein